MGEGCTWMHRPPPLSYATAVFNLKAPCRNFKGRQLDGLSIYWKGKLLALCKPPPPPPHTQKGIAWNVAAPNCNIQPATSQFLNGDALSSQPGASRKWPGWQQHAPPSGGSGVGLQAVHASLTKILSPSRPGCSTFRTRTTCRRT